MLKGWVSWGKTMLWRPEGSEVFVVLFLILLLYTKPKILLHFHREILEWLLQIKFKSGTPWDFKFSILFLWVGIRAPHQRSALACFFSDSDPRWRWGQTLLLQGTCVHHSLKQCVGSSESGFKALLKTTETAVMSVHTVGSLESPGGTFSLWNSVCSSSWKFFWQLFIWLATEIDPSISGTGLTKPGAKRFLQIW